MKAIGWLLVGWLAFGLSGCQGAPKSETAGIVGQWEGRIESLERTDAARLMDPLLEQIRIALRIRPAGRFRMDTALVIQEGVWKREGDRLILTPRSVQPTPGAKVQPTEDAMRPMTLRLQPGPVLVVEDARNRTRIVFRPVRAGSEKGPGEL